MVGNLAQRLDDLNGALRLLVRAGDRALDRDLAFLGKALVAEVLGVPLHVDRGIRAIGVNRSDLRRQLFQSIRCLRVALDLNVISGAQAHDMRGYLDLDRHGHAVVRQAHDRELVAGAAQAIDLRPLNGRLRRGLAVLHDHRHRGRQHVHQVLDLSVVRNLDVGNRLNVIGRLGILINHGHAADHLGAISLDRARNLHRAGSVEYLFRDVRQVPHVNVEQIGRAVRIGRHNLLGHLLVQILLGRTLGYTKRLGLELGDGPRRLANVDVHDSVDVVDVLELADELIGASTGEGLGDVEAVGVGPLFDLGAIVLAMCCEGAIRVIDIDAFGQRQCRPNRRVDHNGLRLQRNLLCLLIGNRHLSGHDAILIHANILALVVHKRHSSSAIKTNHVTGHIERTRLFILLGRNRIPLNGCIRNGTVAQLNRHH